MDWDDGEEAPRAYDQTLCLTINAFSTAEAVKRALDKSCDLDFSGLYQDEADFNEVVPAIPAHYVGTPGAQSVELVLVRRAYMANGHSVTDAEYFLADIQGGRPLTEQPDLPDSPEMAAYRSSLARQEHLDTTLTEPAPAARKPRF